jgi:hypothetical protein
MTHPMKYTILKTDNANTVAKNNTPKAAKLKCQTTISGPKNRHSIEKPAVLISLV